MTNPADPIQLAYDIAFLAGEKAGAESMRERAAKVVEAENKRILATQYHDAKPGTFNDAVNIQTRMTAVMLPETAAAIRALTVED